MYVKHHSACFVTYVLIPLAGEKPVSKNWKSCLHWLRIVLQVGLPGGKKEEDSLAMIIGAAAGGILFVLVLLLVLCCCCCQRKTKRASPNSSTPSSHSSGNSLKMVKLPERFLVIYSPFQLFDKRPHMFILQRWMAVQLRVELRNQSLFFSTFNIFKIP